MKKRVFTEHLERGRISALCRQRHAAPLLTVHRTVNKARRAIIVSGVPPHVVPPEQISRNCCPRSFMGKGRIERPFPIGDALAIASSKSLRELHAQRLRALGYPLLSLFWGKDFALCGDATTVPDGNWTVSKGNCVVRSANHALPAGPRKPLKRLDLNF